ncbi:3-dehydroquinate synthase [Fervidicola ferrireducens]|uniref:Multifunctional fusion protein n=1 Tax=Fervidicola ferrireducens TaxID=520764 RepID=A0A140LBD7_9FIRM|nr:3-dehydroquinate synthase [Fervidicola ferrireducens]KXG77862.1 3-dehydroquinate synthase [Fervidicola ferrireducens]
MVGKNVVLSGLSGSGKTTVGKILARELSRFFVDTDRMLEDSVKMDIPRIFDIYGEEGFREMETAAIKKVSKLKNAVISIGGGAVTKKANVNFLKENGLIVFLDASPDVLLSRLTDDTSRPLLASSSLEEKRKKLQSLYRDRYDLYRQAADLVVNADDTPKAVAEEILRELYRRGIKKRDADLKEESMFVEAPSRNYCVRMGYRFFERPLMEFFKTQSVSKAVIVTNPLLNQLACEGFLQLAKKEGLDVEAVLIQDEEEKKNPDTLLEILDKFASLGLDRESVVVAVGGGVVGDTAGLAAAIYMRGIRWIYVPTTLLAQVDASIGGKVAVNHGQRKNLLGAFHQPSLAVTDVGFLDVLPDEIYIGGLAEVVKSAVIEGDLFNFLEENASKIIERDPKAILSAVSSCVKLKSRIVKEDEHDKGMRMLLNLGHTFGHAIEAALGYRISHGRAVSAGMVLETELSHRMGHADARTKQRIVKLLESFGLPVSLEEIGFDLETRDLIKYMRSDKKAAFGKFRFALPFSVGDVRVVECLPEELERLIK